MKWLLLILLPTYSFAQENFEGVITYKGGNRNLKDSSTLEITYGKSKVRGRAWNNRENKVELVEDFIYDFKENLFYIIDDREKKVIIDSIRHTAIDAFIAEPLAEKQSILGIPVTGYHFKENRLAWEMEQKKNPADSNTRIVNLNDSVNNMKFFAWFGQDISYRLPDLHKKHNLLTSEDGNMLLLRMIIEFPALFLEEKNNDKLKRDSVVITAVAINRCPVQENAFQIPAEYTRSYVEHSESTVTVKEITIEEIEEDEEPPPPPPPPAKPPKKMAKNDSPLKPD